MAFRVVPANVDEADLKRNLAASGSRVGPTQIAQGLAAAKAEAVSSARPEALVIGADQVLALKDELFDKPRVLAEARNQLGRLRGRTHELFTAVALARGGLIVWSHIDKATLTMRHFSGEFLDGYLAEAGSRVCQIVGGYEIEGPGIQLFERVEGDHCTIVGLPLVPLLAELRARGAIPA